MNTLDWLVAASCVVIYAPTFAYLLFVMLPKGNGK